MLALQKKFFKVNTHHYEMQAERFFEKSEKGEDNEADTIYSTNWLE